MTSSPRAKRVLSVSKQTEPCRTELTPVSFLRRSAYLFPDKVAVVHEDRRYTYGQLEERVNRLASGLRARGLRHLDRVAAICPNTPAMLELHFGVPAAGLVLVPINVRLTSDDVAYILAHSGAKVLFVDHEYAGLVKPLELAGVHVIRVDDTGAPGDPYLMLPVLGRAIPTRTSWRRPPRNPASPGCRTSTRRSRSTTRPAPPGGPRASWSTTGAPT